MHHPQPIIGLTFSARMHTDDKVRRIAEAYLEAVRSHGGDPRLLTPGGARPMVGEFDGLLLAGGVDIDPAEYGQERHPKLGEVDAGRDALELPLAREAVAAGVPVFGICRGVQVIGVAAGGALHQDIPSCVPEALVHSGPEGTHPRHRVRVVAGTRLHAIVGEEDIEVNTYHHQAVAAAGTGLRVAAVAPDGVVEAVEGTGSAFLLGVQWHPERMRGDERQEALFRAFVAAATESGRAVALEQ